MAKVFIGVGHGGSDPGAVDIVREADANLVIALEMKRILERNGVSVGISRIRDENDSLSEEIAECNAFGPDAAAEIHNNAGKGDGWECYVQTNGYKAKSRKMAESIETRVKCIGQQSRGIKTRLGSSGNDYFGWLRQCKCPAVLLEGFFVDSKDAYDFDTEQEQKKLAKAYALGMLDYLGIQYAEPAVFTDVAKDAWYADEVASCAELGIMEGDGDGKFRPDEPVTRAEVAAAMLRVLRM